MINFNIKKYFDNHFIQIKIKNLIIISPTFYQFEPTNELILKYTSFPFYNSYNVPVTIQNLGGNTYKADKNPLDFLYFKIPFFYGSLQDIEKQSKENSLLVFAWIPENYVIKNENEANYSIDFNLFLFHTRERTDNDITNAFIREDYLFQLFENMKFSLFLQGMEIKDYSIIEFNKTAVFTDLTKKIPLISKTTDAIQIKISASINKLISKCL